MVRTPNGASSIYLGKDGYWHGRVTVGVKDDGRPDRRHVMGTQADVTRKVRALERQRDSGTVRKAGRSWTVEKWLLHWLENIAAPFVRDNTLSGYRVAVNVHLIPGLGKHRLDRLEPEHLEKLYVRMMRNGSAPATAHQAHRTLRTALNEAVRRGHLVRNPATLAKAPRLVEKEVEPYSVDEVRLLLKAAMGGRNGARWAIALALGPAAGGSVGAQVVGRGSRRRDARRAPGTAAPAVAPWLRRDVRPEVRRSLPATDRRTRGDGRDQVARPGAASSDCQPSSSSCSAPTAPSRTRNAPPRPSSGRTTAGCSPRRPAGR